MLLYDNFGYIYISADEDNETIFNRTKFASRPRVVTCALRTFLEIIHKVVA